MEIYRFSSNYASVTVAKQLTNSWFESFINFFLSFQILEKREDQMCNKMDYEGGPTLNLGLDTARRSRPRNFWWNGNLSSFV